MRCRRSGATATAIRRGSRGIRSTGKLWESEHGPQGGDEINIIEPGHNYGWGVITMGVQPGITKRTEEGMEQPIVYYTPTIAPSGIAFYTGTKYPRLEEQPVRQRARPGSSCAGWRSAATR